MPTVCLTCWIYCSALKTRLLHLSCGQLLLTHITPHRLPHTICPWCLARWEWRKGVGTSPCEIRVLVFLASSSFMFHLGSTFVEPPNKYVATLLYREKYSSVWLNFNEHRSTSASVITVMVYGVLIVPTFWQHFLQCLCKTIPTF